MTSPVFTPVRVWIAISKSRRNVSFIESINLIVELRKRKVEVEQLVLPDEVHDFLRHQNWVRGYKATADFFNRRLKNAKGATETQRH